MMLIRTEATSSSSDRYNSFLAMGEVNQSAVSAFHWTYEALLFTRHGAGPHPYYSVEELPVLRLGLMRGGHCI